MLKLHWRKRPCPLAAPRLRWERRSAASGSGPCTCKVQSITRSTCQCPPAHQAARTPCTANHHPATQPLTALTAAGCWWGECEQRHCAPHCIRRSADDGAAPLPPLMALQHHPHCYPCAHGVLLCGRAHTPVHPRSAPPRGRLDPRSHVANVYASASLLHDRVRPRARLPATESEARLPGLPLPRRCRLELPARERPDCLYWQAAGMRALVRFGAAHGPSMLAAPNPAQILWCRNAGLPAATGCCACK